MIKRVALCAMSLAGAAFFTTDIFAVESGSETIDPQTASILAELQAAVEADPNAASTRMRLGYILRDLGREAEAQRWLNEAVTLDPVLEFAPDADDALSVRGLGTTGPDVYTCKIPMATNAFNWTLNDPGAAVRVYTFPTDSGNGGDAPLDWIGQGSPGQNEQNHPVITQNFFRYLSDETGESRLVQIGMSWCKHGFCALQFFSCGPCQPIGGGCELALGPGCSDPYDAALNGTQFRLGPRSEVNPVTAMKVLPHTVPDIETVTGGRLLIDADQLMGSGDYIVEANYLHPQDIAAGNQYNNSSWRPIGYASATTHLRGIPGETTRQLQQAIFAWQEYNPAVVIQHVDIPGDGRLTVAYLVRQLDEDTWRYEYAIQNYNSDRSAQAFSVPVADGTIISSPGFNDIEHHSGDGVGGVTYDGTDWSTSMANGFFTWATQTFDINDNANAIRWGSMFNFWFDADAPPVEADAVIAIFKPGADPSATVTVMAPASGPCIADLNGDGVVNSTDLSFLLGAWAQGDLLADLDDNAVLNGADLALLLGSWGACL